FFNDPATTEIYTLSLHDALPICHRIRREIPGAWLHGEVSGRAPGRDRTDLRHRLRHWQDDQPRPGVLRADRARRDHRGNRLPRVSPERRGRPGRDRLPYRAGRLADGTRSRESGSLELARQEVAQAFRPASAALKRCATPDLTL